MKKLLSLSLSLLLLFSLSCVAFASNEPQKLVHEETVLLENGNSVVITLYESDAVSYSERSNKTASKKYTYRSSSGSTLWTLTLRAGFSYNGSSSSADSASTSYSISNRDWSCDSHDAYTSGSTAYGEGSFSSVFGASKDASLSIRCDKNGNIR